MCPLPADAWHRIGTATTGDEVGSGLRVRYKAGAWPAFWMFGDDAQHAWPRWGEYDILESIHVENYVSWTAWCRHQLES